MTAQDILTEWLYEHGYDGLGCEFCSCDLNTGIAPCCDGMDVRECAAGHYIPCPGPDACDAYGQGPHFHIGKKEETT